MRTGKQSYQDSAYFDLLKRYANTRLLDTAHYKKRPYLAIIDPSYTRIHILPNGSYHIVYHKHYRITQSHKVKFRKSEHGMLPTDKLELGRFLDRVFFEGDALEEERLKKMEEARESTKSRK